jgi:hypothetical protein
MLLRIRWFLLGVIAALGGGLVAFGRVVRRRLTPAAAGRAAADLLDRLAATIGGDAA